MAIAVRPFDAPFGAEVAGIDLSAPLDEAARAGLRDALARHHILSVHGQTLRPEDVLAASRAFGERLEAHLFARYHHPETPLIVVLSNRVDAETGKPVGIADAGTFWHSDNSYNQAPARATLLYAIEVPDEGGDTLFCDMVAACRALPGPLRARLEGRIAVHNYTHTPRAIFASGEVAPPPDARHPVIRRVPGTTDEAIFVNPAYTVRIEGLDDETSRALLDEVYAHCLSPRFRLRYKWRRGDVVVWDNAAVMHSATTKALDPSRHRTLWRTIISGEPTL
jgi:taurine dioxygenase